MMTFNDSPPVRGDVSLLKQYLQLWVRLQMVPVSQLNVGQMLYIINEFFITEEMTQSRVDRLRNILTTAVVENGFPPVN